MTTTRSCSVCGGTDKRELFRQPLRLPPGLASYGGYSIVACDRCGFVFSDGTISQADSDLHYASPSKVAQELQEFGNSEADVLRLNNTVALLRRFLGPDDRLLDVGCGTGRLIWLMKQSGFEHVSGMDQSPIAVSIGRDTYEVDVKVGSIFEFEERGYDFVTLTHVLEHIVDLSAVLVRLYDLVSPGGRLYVEVPDATQFLAFVDPRSPNPWIYVRDLFTHFAPEHVNFFSPTSLRNLMTRFGFREQYCDSEEMGVVASVWERPNIDPDVRSADVVSGYANASQELQLDVIKLIDELTESGDEFFVWGAGLHTQRLLATGGLNRLKIRAFVDSDSSLAGNVLDGKSIISPTDLESSESDVPILVSSWKGQESILRTITDLGLTNPVFVLYPSSA